MMEFLMSPVAPLLALLISFSLASIPVMGAIGTFSRYTPRERERKRLKRPL